MDTMQWQFKKQFKTIYKNLRRTKINILSAIGNISRNAEIRYLANGDSVASFSFALSSGYGDKQITTWLNCSLWGKRAETLAQMLLKGTKIGISGELTNRPYKAKDGTEKFSLDLRVNDVTLLGGKPNPNNSDDERNYENQTLPTKQNTLPSDDFEEIIPF